MNGSRPFRWDAAVYLASAAIVLALQRKTVVPSFSLLALSVALGAVWVAAGFHVNTYSHLATFDPLGEALNEAAKTAWGLAYLLPLLHRQAHRQALPTDLVTH